MSKWIFEVETKEAGQRRKYGDGHYHYIVKSTMSVRLIKDFCTKLLHPSIPLDIYKKGEKLSADNHFKRYFTKLETIQEKSFGEEGDNIVEYKVVSPSTH